jgi:hypothetical protein
MPDAISFRPKQKMTAWIITSPLGPIGTGEPKMHIYWRKEDAEAFDNQLLRRARFLRRSAPLHITQSFATLFGDHIMHSVITLWPAYNIAGFHEAL